MAIDNIYLEPGYEKSYENELLDLIKAINEIKSKREKNEL